MLEHFCVFTLTGFVLWKYETFALKGQPINDLIKNVILEERTGMDSFSFEGKYTLKWTQANELNLIFVAVYQTVLRLPFIDDFLESVKKSFISLYGDNIKFGKDYPFDKEFESLLKEMQFRSSREAEVVKKPNSFEQSKKKQKLESKGIVIQDSPKKKEKEKDKENDIPAEPAATSSSSPQSSPPSSSLKTSNPKIKVVSGKRVAGAISKKAPKPDISNEPLPGQKRPKQNTVWEDNRDGLKNFNMSDDKILTTIDPEKAAPPPDEDLGIGEEVKIDQFSEESSTEEEEEEEEETAKPKPKSGLLSFFSNIINKELTEKDLEPILQQFSSHLISKNVASGIAESVCTSVSSNLVGKQLSTFSRVSHTVRDAMEEALTRILTPKITIDVLRDARASVRKGKPYVIVFVGVNGVGKSTSLSKVCSWLLQNGLSVMMAACDTFRAGAIEQLQTHGNNLKVPVFHRGYGKDPAGVATEAILHARKTSTNVVLIDTAGRMQDNRPLMTALAKLVAVNEPDLVLFVGEALVGNEAVDQLTKFNLALVEYAVDKKNPRGIDGIFLTKFDTVDEKVGAAISMAYTTGQPIVFVGIGQKYSDLKVLNVQRIVSVLLKGK